MAYEVEKILDEIETELEPLNEFYRLVKAIKACKDLLQQREEELKALFENESFPKALETLKKVNPQAFEQLRQAAEGVENVKTSTSV